MNHLLFIDNDSFNEPCPYCNGTGHIYLKHNLLTNRDEECTEEEWQELSEILDEDAEWIEGDIVPCEECHGEGIVDHSWDGYDEQC